MSFDFKNVMKQAQEELKDEKSDLLGVCILGSQGSGKSTASGSLGVKTLYLHGITENHGSLAARSLNKSDIYPVCYERDTDGNKLEADSAYKNLLNILSSADAIKKEGFKAIVIDSATELEVLIRSTTRWRVACQSKGGAHNAFAEGGSTLDQFREVIGALKDLQKNIGVHYIMTCVLDVKDIDSETAEILESSPQLRSYGVATGILQQFPAIVVVGKMYKNEKFSYRFQMSAGVSRTSKESDGRTVKKQINFSPRIAPVLAEDMPKTLPADLSELVKFKKKVLGGESEDK